MGLSINLGGMADQTIKTEIDEFTIKDEEFRNQLLHSGKILGITPQFGKASTSLNNNVNMFLSTCKKKGIIYPLRDIIAYDLCIYLENLYYIELSDSVESINDLINDYLERNSLIRLFNSKTYFKDLLMAYRVQIQTYNKAVNDLYSFDINKNGNKVIDYVLSQGDNRVEVIRAHKAYHEKMNNSSMLDYITKIK